jgi:pyrimidine operon attenuation protein/uracil phosphoribosyltransferase
LAVLPCTAPGLTLRTRRSILPAETDMQILLDAQGIQTALERLARDIEKQIPPGASVGVIGIRSRGDVLAARLIDLLERDGLKDVAHGALDITLYRDDLAEKGPNAILQKTEIDFDIDARYIVLVDDVLFTGRSVRAALDALVDLGRPVAIRLAVLVDRPGRELPIQADFVGVKVERVNKTVNVLLRETDGQDRVEVI